MMLEKLNDIMRMFCGVGEFGVVSGGSNWPQQVKKMVLQRFLHRLQILQVTSQ